MHYRLRDIFISAIALLLLLPLIALIGFLLFFTQKRIIFLQKRPGLNEKPFTLIKFSTMRDAAPGEDEAERQLERLTPVGKYLRKLSLDEIPQLINVIKGEMSLIGPRPLLMEYLPLYSLEERRRHSVLPGITGWAQINGRNAISFRERFKLDLWYVEHRSFRLDAKILWLTFFRIISQEGVYQNEHITSEKFDGTN